MIKIEGLHFSYGDKRVLKEINLYLTRGDFIGIIGPNGSGKSTFLKTLSGYLPADKGVIYLDNYLLNKVSNEDLARIMAVVPQDTNVDYNFKVYDLIMMGRRPYQNRWGMVSEQDREIVSEVIEMTDTQAFSQENINKLSGGERQRVIIARALAQEPDILLLDEPTASLDINYQGEIFDLLAKLNRDRGITIILVSHDLNLSGQYCDRLILLKDGQVYKTGIPTEVLRSETIAEVYQSDVIIEENPFTGKPYLIMVPGGSKKKLLGKRSTITENTPKIHLICGGGSGRKMFSLLHNKDFQLSCGVLNIGDSDWETARRLNLKMAESPPFNPISKQSLEYNRQLMTEADIILLAETPFGHGNLDNLKLLLDLSDKTIILKGGRKFQERDFTGGEATLLWQELKQRPGCYLKNKTADILQLIEDLIEI
ncbi:MAG: ABC transporter ATP-binding protein [Firmicutes bacterium]|nr:ABC transporter ATP-binding protein [Bacillota bacterium]